MKKKIFYIVLTMIVSSAVVVVLFLTSEHIMKRENPFVRRFMPHPISDVRGLELPYNSYYFAGYSDERIYLGNYTAPLHGLVLSTKPAIIDTLVLQLEDFEKHKFSSIKWGLSNDTIWLHDYSVPVFYSGLLHTKKLYSQKWNNSLSYSQAIPLDSDNYILRTFNTNKNNVNLSLLNLPTQTVNLFPGILDEENKPADLFSNDGILLYNRELEKIIYVFYYKNKSFVFDKSLQNKKVLQTIDTITAPNFKINYLEKQNQLKRNTNAIKVHKTAATAGNFLFIASDRRGKNENKQMYDEATIIDVYDLRDASYSYSFYFYHHENTAITQFHIYHNFIVGIGKNKLSIAKFKQSIYD